MTHTVNAQTLQGDTGEKCPRRFFRWFWDFLKEENVFLSDYLLQSFTLICFSNVIYIFSQC